MRLLRIEPRIRSVVEDTISVPQEGTDALERIKSLTSWKKPMCYHYRGHSLWVDEQADAGPAFTLMERGTTLGPFQGTAWIVAENPQGRIADATLTVADVPVSWKVSDRLHESSS
jgi:hypothetical protein